MRLVKYWFLEESFNMMKRIGMKAMMKLSDLLVMKTYHKGSQIHEQFDDEHLIYFIKKGHVKIGHEKNGEFELRYTLGKGNIFGESKIISEKESVPYTAIAMSECTICFIEVDRMEELMAQYPKLHNSVMKIAGVKFRKIERRLDDILYKNAEIRIKDFLIDFVKENALEEDDRHVKNIFSQSDIAKLTSTSRQTVNNVISKLRKDEIIAYSNKEIRIIENY